MAQMRISAKDLGVLALPGFCPRCFWLRMRCQNKLPFQIFPGIFSSIDSYTKKVTGTHFARYNQLPPWLRQIAESGRPVKVPHHSKFKIIDEKTDVALTGAPDEIIRRDDGSHFIIDYKTSRFTKTQDSLLPLYQVQLNAYAYIGERQGFDPISGLALVYMEPQTDLTEDQLDSVLRDDGFLMGFAGHVLPLKLEAEQIIPPLLERVRSICDLDEAPRGRQDCRDCGLLEQLITVLSA
jgi:hypothetical protein